MSGFGVEFDWRLFSFDGNRVRQPKVSLAVLCSMARTALTKPGGFLARFERNATAVNQLEEMKIVYHFEDPRIKITQLRLTANVRTFE